MSAELFGFLGLLFSIVSIIMFFIGRHQGRKEIEGMKNEIKGHSEQLTNTLIEKSVEIANAQSRVKDGGRVVLRDKKEVIGAHERNIPENVNVGEDVVKVVRKQKRELFDNVEVSDSVDVKVTRAKDKEVVTRQQKTFTTDAILVNEEDKENKPQKQKDEKKEH